MLLSGGLWLQIRYFFIENVIVDFKISLLLMLVQPHCVSEYISFFTIDSSRNVVSYCILMDSSFGFVVFPPAPKKGMVKFPGKGHFKRVTTG